KYCPNINTLVSKELDRNGTTSGQIHENTPNCMRGWTQTKGEDGFKVIHYPFKFLLKKYRSVDLLSSKELTDTCNDQPVPSIYNKEKYKEHYQLNNINDVFAIKKSRVMWQKNRLKGTKIAKFSIQKTSSQSSHQKKRNLIHSAFVLLFLFVCYFAIAVSLQCFDDAIIFAIFPYKFLKKSILNDMQLAFY
ncbi:hypothetical protein RFI_38400, partial [Reticulomyxa filosa]